MILCKVDACARWQTVVTAMPDFLIDDMSRDKDGERIFPERWKNLKNIYYCLVSTLHTASNIVVENPIDK